MAKNPLEGTPGDGVFIRYESVPNGFADLEDVFLDWRVSKSGGSFLCSTVKGGSAIPESELDAYIAYWKVLGIFIEITWDGNDLNVQATNSTKPLSGVSGVWFQAWSDRIEAISADSKKDMEAKHGHDPNFRKLAEIDFDPGVWVGPDYEPTYFSDATQKLIIENAEQVIQLVTICSEKLTQWTKDRVHPNIATSAVPSIFAGLGDSLASEYLDTLCSALEALDCNLREDIIAHALPHIVKVVSPEKCTPALLEKTCQQLQSLREVIDSPDRMPSHEMHELCRWRFGWFVDGMGESYDPEYLAPFAEAARNSYAVRKDVHELISCFAPEIFEQAKERGEKISLEEFRTCVAHVRGLFEELRSAELIHLAYSMLPGCVRGAYEKGKPISETVKGVTDQLARVEEFSDPGGVLNMPLKHLGFQLRNPEESERGSFPVEELQATLDELFRVERVFGKEFAHRLWYGAVPYIISAHPGDFSAELLHQYMSKFEKLLEAEEVDREVVLGERSHDTFATFIRHTQTGMTPAVLEQYIDFTVKFGTDAPDIVQTICAPAQEEGVNPQSLEKAFQVARRIAGATIDLPSKIPLKVLEDIVDHMGFGNDFKSIQESIELAERYAAFLETHSNEVKSLCPPITVGEDDYSERWDEEKKQRDGLLALYAQTGGIISSAHYSPEEEE